MAMTPEGKVKLKVKKLLTSVGAYNFWPVQTGYGAATVDCLGCYRGRFFAIETKAKGKKPTPRQLLTMEGMAMSGATVFVIDPDNGLEALKIWLDSLPPTP